MPHTKINFDDIPDLTDEQYFVARKITQDAFDSVVSCLKELHRTLLEEIVRSYVEVEKLQKRRA